MNDVALARALHVLGVVVWIGGVSLVTTVVLPAARRGELASDPLRAFRAIERRFVRYARAAVLLVGATGLYLLARLDLWALFRNLRPWWIHAMVGLWLVFAGLLFVIEPLGLRPHLEAPDPQAAASTLARLHRIHVALLIAALITVFGAVAGSHGAWTGATP